MGKKLTTDQFIARSVSVHGLDYDYSGVNYVNAWTKVSIKCLIHGVFSQRPYAHMDGAGCPMCGLKKKSERCVNYYKSNRPSLSHITAPEGSCVVPVGANGKYAIIDKEDYGKVIKYTWYYSDGYAKTNKIGSMHRLIMNANPGQVIDHINHNQLDNRKKNLRICTQKENLRNRRPLIGTSKFKGVSYDKINHKWVSNITVDGQQMVLGRFCNELDAAKSYDTAAKKYFGEFAYLNFGGQSKI